MSPHRPWSIAATADKAEFGELVQVDSLIVKGTASAQQETATKIETENVRKPGPLPEWIPPLPDHPHRNRQRCLSPVSPSTRPH